MPPSAIGKNVSTNLIVVVSESCQRPARFARTLLRFREYLHGLLVLRRELLPLQIERRQETLE